MSLHKFNISSIKSAVKYLISKVGATVNFPLFNCSWQSNNILIIERWL